MMAAPHSNKPALMLADHNTLIDDVVPLGQVWLDL